MQSQPTKRRFNIQIIYLVMMVIFFLVVPRLINGFGTPPKEIPYSEFKTALYAGKVRSVSISDIHVNGKMADGTSFTSLRVNDPDLINALEAQNVETSGLVESSGGGILGTLAIWIFPLIMIAGIGYFFIARSMKGGAGSAGGIFSFGKSKARVIQGEQTGVTFKDVGGAGEAVTDLKEVTEFLKNPVVFQRLGGKMPKGVLLVGPPGTGKTLLARATAGEAGGQFFNLSGAEFVEMFVGVGASRVRDLFVQAKKSTPSIIFIDEIDAIGGRRAGAGAMGVHEEREQTLNQLLAEMDGFETSRGVIVMAATNRPEILDPALLRPGRFDRQIMVDLPDRLGRLEILKIHTQAVTLAVTNLEEVSQITPGFSGADLANLVNEAALLASRQGKEAVDRTDFDAAFERVVAGTERRTRTINPNEKKVIAIHEAGHALVASLIPGADKVHKVTIVPRGRALGYTMQLPTDDRYLMGERELETRLIVLVGGRVAEELVFLEPSTGAMDDLAHATDLARRMVTEYGMSPILGPVRLATDLQATYLNQQLGLDARVSPETATLVDTETRRIIEEAVDEAKSLLIAHRTDLDRLADLLCERETVDGSQIDAMLGRTETGVELDDNPHWENDGGKTSPDEDGSRDDLSRMFKKKKIRPVAELVDA
jgi:cell division protease FtsH